MEELEERVQARELEVDGTDDSKSLESEEPGGVWSWSVETKLFELVSLAELKVDVSASRRQAPFNLLVLNRRSSNICSGSY